MVVTGQEARLGRVTTSARPSIVSSTEHVVPRRHLEWVSHRDGNKRFDLKLCQNREPKREQPRDRRVLHAEQRRGAVLVTKQSANSWRSSPRCGRYESSVWRRRHIVPGRTDAPQESVDARGCGLRFPEPQLVVGLRRQDVLGKLAAHEVQHARQRGRPAPVGTDDDDSAARGNGSWRGPGRYRRLGRRALR